MPSISSPTWEIPDTLPTLADNQLHLWRVDLDAGTCVRDWLGDGELSRLATLSHPLSARRFCNMRSLLRFLLGHYCGCPPRHLALTIGSGGKPALAPPGAVHFNLTHSDGHGLIAFSRTVEVGIDLELQREFSGWQRIARRVFSAAQIARLQRSADPVVDFFRQWTALEARQKCLGRGVFGTQVGVDDVALQHFRPTIGQIAAVAWADPHWRPQLRYFEAGSCLFAGETSGTSG